MSEFKETHAIQIARHEEQIKTLFRVVDRMAVQVEKLAGLQGEALARQVKFEQHDESFTELKTAVRELTASLQELRAWQENLRGRYVIIGVVIMLLFQPILAALIVNALQ